MDSTKLPSTNIPKPTLTVRANVGEIIEYTNIIFLDWQDDRIMIVDINFKAVYIPTTQIMHIWVD